MNSCELYDASIPPGENSSDAVNTIHALKKLTENFRSSLRVWKDLSGNARKVIIDGTESELLYADSHAVLKYAREYTRIWRVESDMMKVEMVHSWFIDCRGLYIDGYAYSSQKDTEWAPVRFNQSTIASQTLFKNQIFLNSVSFCEAVFTETIDFDWTEFKGPADFSFATFLSDANFWRAQFWDVAKFQRLKAISGSIDFSRATFHRAPRFHETKLPQGTSFDGADFQLDVALLDQREIEQESLAFRTLKQAATGYRGQQDEADFFALEQMTRRKSFLAPHIEWKTNTWRTQKSGLRELANAETLKSFREWRFRARPLEWILSLLYDWISNYGRSIGKALTCFMLSNVGLTVLYRYGYTFGDCSSVTSAFCIQSVQPSSFAYANPSIQLTLQNLLNPAGLATEKSVVAVHSPTLIGICLFQSAFSFLVLFLAALAIRTRFQKGGGGSS